MYKRMTLSINFQGFFKATMINYYAVDKGAPANETIYHLAILKCLNRQLEYDLKLQIFTLMISDHRQTIITLAYRQ